MYDLTPIRTDGMNIRADHNTTSAILGSLDFGVHAVGENIYTVQQDGEAKDAKLDDKWMRVTSPMVGWVAIIHDGISLSVVTPLTLPPPTDEYVLHVKNGVTRKFIPE